MAKLPPTSTASRTSNSRRLATESSELCTVQDCALLNSHLSPQPRSRSEKPAVSIFVSIPAFSCACSFKSPFQSHPHASPPPPTLFFFCFFFRAHINQISDGSLFLSHLLFHARFGLPFRAQIFPIRDPQLRLLKSYTGIQAHLFLRSLHNGAR